MTETPSARRYRYPGDLIPGALLALEPASWEKLHLRARRSIRKARQLGVQVAVSADFAAFRPMHYNPPGLPDALKASQTLLLATLDGEPVGGLVIEQLTDSLLLYRYAATNERGRQAQANSLLAWSAVEQYADSR